MGDLTDREALEQLLARFGLEPRTESVGPEVWIALRSRNGGVEGYSGFEATFMFDASGKFKTLRVWE